MHKHVNLKRTDFLLKNSFKFGFTIFMTTYATLLFLLLQSQKRELVMFAAIFGTIGDLCLMNYKNIPQLLFGGKEFYAGIVAFGTGHVLYHMAYLEIYRGARDVTVANLFFLLILLSIVLLIAISCEVRSSIKDFAFIIYALCIFSNVGMTGLCAFSFGGQYTFAFIGAILFLISDVLILIRETKKDTPLIRKIIWIMYPLGQLLLITLI